ncbi:hypothetical protein ACIPJG_01075 [Streptomyces halstedii]|uniref:hypothetical protein n=1 Tax=Streptomyces TaxID=1883 RepID=UPI0004A8DD1F|nr:MULTISPECIES: hypothetical protein [unclassified Streptomyces]WSX37990.1 hypothetical protein OG291_21235 [Streptomyces halstedii]KDQ67454.1 hypothetical protein DT87_09560 [Streptomyces sp. NTK 937]MYQ53640.1 hypothetical protein [Streptomyces sp. SID4941]SCE09370.1 hypothetical protein GA0115247_122925 [Streptomyces sp. PalvLS-984]SDD08725.1 hypothetical protein F558DRAFT_03275 [Streptomyces sp. AmelKG-A3]
MRRGLVHALAWSLATGASVTLSWWGVHTVLSGTAYDRPRAVPVSVGAGGDRATEEPVSSSTHRAPPSPAPSATATRAASPPGPRSSSPRPPSGRPSGGGATSAAPSVASGDVESYPTRGGRVVLELAPDAATLVSATPEPGWSMAVWTENQWIRVDFSDGAGATVSVFCTWNGHPPAVEVVDR